MVGMCSLRWITQNWIHSGRCPPDISNLIWLVQVFSGGSKGGVRDARPPGRPNSFNFMQFLGEFGKIVRPPGGFTPPPGGNPGSVTGIVDLCSERELTELDY